MQWNIQSSVYIFTSVFPTSNYFAVLFFFFLQEKYMINVIALKSPLFLERNRGVKILVTLFLLVLVLCFCLYFYLYHSLFFLKAVDFIQDYCNRGERLGTSSNTSGQVGIYNKRPEWGGSKDGELLRDDFSGRGFLLNQPNTILDESRPRTQTSKVGDEELDQIAKGMRLGLGFSLNCGNSIVAKTGWCRPSNDSADMEGQGRTLVERRLRRA